MNGPAALAVTWFAIVSLACVLCWPPPVRRWLARRRYPWLLAALVAVVARVLPALLPMPASALVQWDLQSYRVVAEAVAQHRDVYDLPGRYPYLPLHLYVFFAADWLSTHTALPFLPLVKLPAVAADAALAALVGHTAAALGRRRDAPALAMVFALNPVSLLVTGYHGQIDAVPLALVFGAWNVLAFRRAWWALPLAALLLGLAIADKTWPVLLAPVLLWRVRGAWPRAAFVALAAVPVAACLAAYEWLVAGGALHALRVVASYQGMIGAWGFSELLTRAAGPERHEAAVRQAAAAGLWVLLPALAVAFVSAARLRRDPERMALIIATVYVSAAGWGVQWLSWLVPFALVSGRRWSAAYVAAAAAYATTIYFAFGGVFWAAVWVTGSLEPVSWSPTAGLILWAGLTAAVTAVLARTLGGDAAPLLRWAARSLAAMRRPALLRRPQPVAPTTRPAQEGG